MERPIEKTLVAFCGLIGAVLLGVVVYTLTRPSPPPPLLPNPNGYDDFVKAGQMLAADFADYRLWTAEQLRKKLASNTEALSLVKAGLHRECRVRLDYSPGMSTHFSELPALKRLTYVLAAEGRLAELENRPRDAARAYVDGVRLGQEAVRGGVIIDALVGIAMEAIAVQNLEKLAYQLDAASCRESVVALEEIETRRASASQVLQDERKWVRQAYGVRAVVMRLLNFRSTRQTDQSLVSKVNAQRNRTCALMVDLARRACELETGRPPKTAADLVPQYLKAIPKDPRTGTNMVFHW